MTLEEALCIVENHSSKDPIDLLINNYIHTLMKETNTMSNIHVG